MYALTNLLSASSAASLSCSKASSLFDSARAGATICGESGETTISGRTEGGVTSEVDGNLKEMAIKILALHVFQYRIPKKYSLETIVPEINIDK